MPKIYSLGCLKDIVDPRDIPMAMVLPVFRVPSKVDYTSKMTPVRDQGDEGTCVAFASVVGVKEYFDSLEYHKALKLSVRFLYSWCKKLDGSPAEEGTYPRIAMKVLSKYGTCSESCWPYKPHRPGFPCAGSEKEAKTYRIKAYARLKSVNEMKRSLLVNGPFLAGVKVFDSWFTAKVTRSGLIPLPKKADKLEGGHAICVVGYDDSCRIFKFKNSWSNKWGDKGYGYMSYEYVRKYCMDAWSATDLIEDPKMMVRMLQKGLRAIRAA